MKMTITALAVLLLTGCGENKPAASNSGTTAPKSAAAGSTAAPASTPAQANARFEAKALPAIHARAAGVVPALKFVAKSTEKGVTFAVPVGWKPGMFNSFKPADDSLGFFTKYSVDTNCDGMCGPKDWKAVAQKVDFDPLLKSGSFTVIKDEVLTNPEGRLLIGKGGTMGTRIKLARWKPGAVRYLICEAKVEDAAVALVPVFEEACRHAEASFLR